MPNTIKPSVSRKLTVALVYGFAEGPLLSRRMQTGLEKAGFVVIANHSAADIVIAHSGGCLLATGLKATQQAIFINPTYWPGNNPSKQAIGKLLGDVRAYLLKHPLHYMYKNFLNIFYLLTDRSHTQALKKAARNFNLPNSLPSVPGQIIIIRTHDDTWCTPDLSSLRRHYPSLTIRMLPGDHDDCWFHPAAYINLLQ